MGPRCAGPMGERFHGIITSDIPSGDLSVRHQGAIHIVEKMSWTSRRIVNNSIGVKSSLL